MSLDILRRSSKLGLEAFSTTSRSLSDLLLAGVPVGDSLDALATREARPAVRAFLKRLSQGVRSGSSLSSIMKSDAARPPRLMVGLITAGEASGALGRELATLADSLETSARTRREMLSQLVYPAALSVMVLLTIAFVSWFVLPQFEKVFAASDARPPIETRIVLSIGRWIRADGALIPLFVVSLVAGVAFALTRYRLAVERWLAAIPHRRRLYQASRNRFDIFGHSERCLRAVLLSPNLSQLHRERARLAERDIKSGAMLSAALSQHDVVLPESLAFADLGERTGRLGEMLLKGAGWNEMVARSTLSRAAALLGPIMTVLMGSIVASVIAAVMSGVLSLNDAIN